MTLPDLPQTVVLHLGAHKTASTHLQRSIGAAGPHTDLAFVGPPMLRGPGESLPERFGFPLDPENGSASALSVRDVLRGLAQGRPRLVLSDENFAGKLKTGWGRIPTPLYFTAAQRIAALAERITHAGGPAIDLCLGLRDPAGYLNSAYSQILHGKSIVDPESFRAKNPLTVVDWATYLSGLRAVPHVRSITVWRQEDYAPLFDQICVAMLGRSDVKPLQDRLQQRLSVQAVEAVLLAKALNAGNIVADAAEEFPVSDLYPAYDLFNAKDQMTSDALYKAQWDTIAALDGVTALGATNA